MIQKIKCYFGKHDWLYMYYEYPPNKLPKNVCQCCGKRAAHILYKDGINHEFGVKP